MRAKVRIARANQLNAPENNPEIGRKISKAITGRIPWNAGLGGKNDPRMINIAKSAKRRMEEMNKNWHKYHTEESIKRTMQVQSPTSIEIKLSSIIERYHLPFIFVGNGQVIIGGKIPDFINANHRKQVIELFGNYWHSLERTGRIRLEEEQHRINIFAIYGYTTLVIWEDELENEIKLVRKIKEFSEE